VGLSWRNHSAPAGAKAGLGVGILSPHPGLESIPDINPRLTPWATFCRASGATARRASPRTPYAPAPEAGKKHHF